MKYSLEITNKDVVKKDSIITTIGKDGFAIKTGWIQVYHYYDDTTNEYAHTSYTHVVEGTGIPAGSTLEAPVIPADNKAIVRSPDGNKWEYPDDYRGKTVFNTETQEALLVDYIGEIKTGFTLLIPETQFDKWDGEKWVKDVEAENLAKRHKLEDIKRQKLYEATYVIGPLQDAVDLDMATEEEKNRLTAWKRYRVFVNRIDTSTAQEINWPEKPE